MEERKRKRHDSVLGACSLRRDRKQNTKRVRKQTDCLLADQKVKFPGVKVHGAQVAATRESTGLANTKLNRAEIVVE